MAAFQDNREQTEKKVMVHLLTEIERNPSFTQRGLAGELGIALGFLCPASCSCSCSCSEATTTTTTTTTTTAASLAGKQASATHSHRYR